MEKLKSIFLRDTSKPLFWILLGIVIKGIPFFFLLHNRPPSDIAGTWGATMGDTYTYIDSIENLLKYGNYSPDYRMPGYGVVYLLFRLLGSQAFACNCLIILQFLLAGISIYYLALTAKAVSKNDKIFYVCFYLFLFSTYSNFYDGWLYTESFCSSALIFSAWFFVKYFQSGKTNDILFSGVFLTWAIFLRPAFVLLIFVFLFVLFFQKRKEYISIPLSGKSFKLFKIVLVFILPFTIMESSWVARNYCKHRQLIPLSYASAAPDAEDFYVYSLRDFIRSWGGSADNTDNNSYLFWFGYRYKNTPIPKGYSKQIPDKIYTSKFNKDSLTKVKNLIISLNDSTLTPDKRLAYQTEVKEKLDRYTLSVKDEKPVLYYLESTLLHSLPRFLFGPEVKLYMKRFQFSEKINSITESLFTLFYYAIIFLGVTGIFLLLFTGLKENPLSFIIAAIPLYTIFVHAVALRVTNNRFLMPAWPFLVLCAAHIILWFFSKKTAIKKP